MNHVFFIRYVFNSFSLILCAHLKFYGIKIYSTVQKFYVTLFVVFLNMVVPPVLFTPYGRLLHGGGAAKRQIVHYNSGTLVDKRFLSLDSIRLLLATVHKYAKHTLSTIQ